ncbi:MAG TPA: tRNA pseudouridine(54/55) synthase Pus10, partial [Candidatus Thermoplasmatota archaeon]|nr:tRNA pseudouridine(54/55) synthase Pus10 [Candidatus Thermoplasmatota archaeon]
AREVAPRACFVCEGLLAEIDLFAEAAVAALSAFDHRNFLIGTRVDPAVEAREAEANAALGTADTAERIQAELNRETGKRVAARTGKAVELKAPDLAAVVDTRFLDAELQHGGLHVFGRYRKHARDVPQTRWPCRRCGGIGCVRCGGTGKQYATSVEEFVAAPFLAATGATQESFHGAGREDVDARTLGEGRPFILELKDPRRRALDLDALAAEVARASGGVVEVHALRVTTKDEVAAIKEHRGAKTYVAEVAFGSPVPAERLREAVDALRGRQVQQRTPQRVEHRRADLVRERRVLGVEVEAHEGDRARLRIHGDAGLYIKELVSGDEGRTEPSLAGLLGAPARVTELDIVAVEYAPSSS